MIRKYFFAALFLFPVLFSFASNRLQAQVVPSATRSGLSLTAGGMVSVFKPDYVPNKLGGVGGYIDLNIFHGIGVEAEGRWQRFNEFEGISQDNYLIGPRYQFRHFWKVRPYAKGLVGYTNMNFGSNVGTGRFTTLAVGGGIDLSLSRRISVRAFDAEYQYWPDFLGGALRPYGASVGIGYRIF
jgi:hypothetical protein